MSLPPDDIFISKHNMQIEGEIPKRKEPNIRTRETCDPKLNNYMEVSNINNDLPIISLFFILIIAILFFIVNSI